MVVGTRQAGLRRAETTGLFPHNNIYFFQSIVQKRKNPMCGSSLGEKAFLMPKVRGE